ncbi:hypothetical protein TSAR_010160 [Trichomalopsis sarcophagae]|uniref:Uncharacterized protein n=1 Tax=Trichomalopsis sarcophagae TaxID=543379 RepID=A0A232FMY8_9HYME|nr:hypothetical protein TSAR_010160 [Trichomalopsis sarcophagae]
MLFVDREQGSQIRDCVHRRNRR